MGSRSSQFSPASSLEKWEKLNKKDNLSVEFRHQVQRNIDHLNELHRRHRNTLMLTKSHNKPSPPFFAPMVAKQHGSLLTAALGLLGRMVGRKSGRVKV